MSTGIESTEPQGIFVYKDPSSRAHYLAELSKMDGLDGLEENPNTAYCALSLTSTPEELKPIIKKRQETLIEILREAGITAYDPGSSPFSPDANLTIGPEEIYRFDKGRVVASRFFVTHDLLPSTGVGVELEAARTYNRISVVLHDNGIRTSRMQPNRTIHLAYDDFQAQAKEFVEVFRFLKQFQPGIGVNHGTPVLLGFDNFNKPIDLEEEVKNKFPRICYRFNGSVPNAHLSPTNPDLFHS